MAAQQLTIELSALHFESEELVLAAISFTISVIIVILGRLTPRLRSHTRHLRAVQAMHTRHTPRIGGIGIFGAIALSVLLAPEAISERYGYFVMATTLIFSVGLLEDFSGNVSARMRLLAAGAASLLVIWFLGVWLPRADIPGLDGIIGYWPVGIPLTLLLTIGIANGFNLIDGVNGLAAMTAIIAAVAMSLIADKADYNVMVHLAMMLAASVFGFFLVNYPFGFVFLGDAGAYTLGFVLSWFGIAILVNAPEATPWAILLVLFWPVADTLLAIYRRSRRKAGLFAPDRLHVHQLVMRAIEICFLNRNKRHIANPLTTLVLAPFVIAPPAVGVIFWDQTDISFAAVVIFGVMFFASYASAPLFIRRFRRDMEPRRVTISKAQFAPMPRQDRHN
jgi:UDP-GlcNAc:undecaprenyl-phosphate/decaprenyl-phosphate GlcNAc-1-phosphate transferase